MSQGWSKSVIRNTLMQQKTYQMLGQIAEGEERRRGHEKEQKIAKKRNCRPKIKQKGWQRWQMSYGNESQSNGGHT